MLPRTAIVSGAKLGAAVGLAVFVGDLVAVSAALGALFDPTWQSCALLLVPAMLTTLAGSILGALGAALARRVVPRRPALALVVAASLVAAVTGFFTRRDRQVELASPPTARAPEEAPSVLWIVADTLRADTLYGDKLDFPLTPKLGKWARERAVIFADAEATAGWTLPSVASFSTSMHPETLYHPDGYLLPSWAPTAAERLHAAGWATHAIVDNAILEPRDGYAAGFQTWWQRSAMRFAFAFPAYRVLPRIVRELFSEAMHVHSVAAPRVTDEAVRRIAEHRDGPMFLYVHYMDPHDPFYEHDDQPPPPTSAVPASYALARHAIDHDPTRVPTAGELEFFEHRYANEIRAMDRHLTRLIEAWEHRFGERAVVALFADHGEEFMEHGGLGHLRTLYRELVHVPFVLRGPGLPARVVREPVSLIDVLPTTLDLVQVDAEDGSMQGGSWAPHLRGEAPAPSRPLVSQQYRLKRLIYRQRHGDWAFLRTRTDGREDVAQELFDKARDYDEQKNLADSDPERVAELERGIEATVSRDVAARQPMDGEDPGDDQALRALGYVR